MKKLLFFLLPFVVGTGFCQTDLYHAFPDSNAVWHGHLYVSGSDSHFQYGIIGDTVLDGLVWHKIYREENCLDNPLITTQNSILTGALREDSAKRIFYYNIAGNSWLQPDSVYLLYDFSMQEGDTIYYMSPPIAYEFLVLDSIDSVMTAGQYRRRFHLSNYDMPLETWIEGIGSTRDLLSAAMPYPTCSCLLELFCFRQEDITYYIQSPYLDCYDLDMSLKETTVSMGTVFPNPSNSNITVKLERTVENASLQIHTIEGQLVMELNRLSGNTFQTHIDLKPGIYFIRLQENTRSILEEKLLID